MADADVIIIGAGLSGMATGARLQARGVKTLVLEAHGLPGGCAGYFRTKGFTFDVGATTLVDFEPEGVGGQFLDEIGLNDLEVELLPGYKLWMPDLAITLYRDASYWAQERLSVFGDTPETRQFWALMDELALTFWRTSRAGVKLPMKSVTDVWNAARKLSVASWPMARYMMWTMADAVKKHHLEEDPRLRSFLAAIIQDTVHSSVELAPLINSALGITIRGAGLTRAKGGMGGFWDGLVRHYRMSGGDLRVGTKVTNLFKTTDGYAVVTNRGALTAKRVISTLPIWNTAELGCTPVTKALTPWLKRDKDALGGAIAVYLGVPEAEVAGEDFTHHQIVVDHNRKLNDGNNMFISVSSAGDLRSAPAGYRSVMLSTHCDLEQWEDLTFEEYHNKKEAICDQLVGYARQVYPTLDTAPIVRRIGTPQTYARYTNRHRGAVGGIRQMLSNSNQNAVPYDIGVKDFWQMGDTTWPGLGTVASVLASKHVADAISG